MLNTFPFSNPLIPDALTGGDPIEIRYIMESLIGGGEHVQL